MHVEKTGAIMDKPRSTCLPIALWSVVLATAGVLLVATIRTGPNGLVMGLVRVALLVLLTILALRGKSWARWTLVAWLGFATILFLTSLVAAVDYPLVLALFVGMIGLHLWAILELVRVDIAGPSVTSV
jgi:hypothetical protein